MKDNPVFRSYDSIARPANVTQYALNDVVNMTASRMFKFNKMAPCKGMPFYILKAILLSTNVPTVAGTFNLHLYRSEFAIAADNAAFAPSLIDSLGLMGTIVFDTAFKTSVLTYYYPSDFTYMFAIPSSSEDSVYGVLTDGSTYTPASGEQFTPILIGQEWL